MVDLNLVIAGLTSGTTCSRYKGKILDDEQTKNRDYTTEIISHKYDILNEVAW